MKRADERFVSPLHCWKILHEEAARRRPLLLHSHSVNSLRGELLAAWSLVPEVFCSRYVQHGPQPRSRLVKLRLACFQLKSRAFGDLIVLVSFYVVQHEDMR